MAQFIQTVDPDREVVPLSIFADRPLTIAPEDYPNGTWSQDHAFYNKWWAYWKGQVLEKRTSDGEMLVYPMKLNMVEGAVLGHSAMLLGQFKDRIVQFGTSQSEAVEKEASQSLSRTLNMLWAVNDGDNLLLEAAIFQQVFGGCYFKVAWSPTRKRWPIRYYVADPRAVFPVWDGDDYNRMVAVDLIHQIPKPTAQARYRVDIRSTASSVDWVTVQEHWDESEYSVVVDGEVAKWPDGAEMRGANPFIDPVLGYPVIPVVYAPRIRAGAFAGDSLVPSVIGPQMESNDGYAHLMEGLADAMHQQPWVRNRAKGRTGLHTHRNEWLDLGMTQLGTDAPEVGRLEGANITQPMVDLVTGKIITTAREHMGLPDVAWGSGTASIRSALTMAFLMMPSTNRGSLYRLNMSTALKWMNYTAMVMALSKSKYLGKDGIDASEKMIEAIILAHKTSWPPMLPSDRNELVNEMTQRISAGTISIESAIERLDGPDFVKDEIERIKENKVEAQEAAIEQMKAQAEFAPKPVGVTNESGATEKKKPPSDRTNNAQAKGGRAKGEGE